MSVNEDIWCDDVLDEDVQDDIVFDDDICNYVWDDNVQDHFECFQSDFNNIFIESWTKAFIGIKLR